MGANTSTTAESGTPAADNIRTIVELEKQAAREATLTERLGQWITETLGTIGFVAGHSVAMALWIGWNLAGPDASRFDPYPFGLLTFIVSLEGVLIATFVLIAQNRMSRQSDQRDHLNLQISMLAEQELTLMLKIMRQISTRLEIAPENAADARAEKLAEETNVYEIVDHLRRELPEVDESAGK